MLNINPVVISPTLTHRCNFQCAHCLGNYGPRQKHIKLNVMHRIVSWINSNSHLVDYVNIASGEPTLYPNLKEFITELDSESSIRIVTNGSWIRSKSKSAKLIEIINILSDKDWIHISSDQYHQEFIARNKLLEAKELLELYNRNQVEISIDDFGKRDYILPVGRAYTNNIPVFTHCNLPGCVRDPSLLIDIEGNIHPCCDGNSPVIGDLLEDIDVVVLRVRVFSEIIREKELDFYSCQHCRKRFGKLAMQIENALPYCIPLLHIENFEEVKKYWAIEKYLPPDAIYKATERVFNEGE